MGLFPGRGTKMPHASRCSQKKKKIVSISIDEQLEEWEVLNKYCGQDSVVLQQFYSYVSAQEKWKYIPYGFGLVHKLLSNLIHNTQILETASKSINHWTDKLCYSHKMWYYLAIKRNKLLIHRHIIESGKHSAEWKNPNTKEYILHDSIYMKFYKRQIYSVVTESRSIVDWGWGRRIE